MKTVKFFLIVFFTLAVAACNGQGLHQTVPKDSKVFILFQGNPIKEVVTNLKYWGYWKIVDKRDSADYVMKIIATKSGSILSENYSAYAEFMDKQNATIFTTLSASFGDRKNTIIHLVHRRVINGKN